MLRTELLEKLELVAPGLSSIDLIPLLTHLWFKGDTVMGYNDQIAIQASYKTGLKCAVPGQTLISLLRNSDQKEVELELVDQTLHVKLKRSDFTLGILPSEDFIFEMPKANGGELPVDFMRFRGAIECCMRSISTDTSIPDQLGITLIIEGDNINLYSTNNSTISHAKVPLNGKAPFKERVVLSAPFCKEMLELTKTVVGTIYIADDHSLMTRGSVSLFGRLIEVDKPIPFAKVLKHHLPDDHRKKAVEMPDRLAMMLTRAMVITDSPTEQTKTLFTVKDGSMTLLSESGKGKVKDVVKVEGHPDVSVKLEPKLLSLGLADFDNFLVTDQCAIMSRGTRIYMVAATSG